MRWFRRRRVDLGTYVAPYPAEPAPDAQIVADGALIGESVVRLALRNRVIVDALRDRRDLDVDALAEVAAMELETLADREWESAERIRFRRDQQRVDDPLQDDEDLDSERLQESKRRERLHRAMSEAFAERAGDPRVLADIVERSRNEAWAEIGPVLIARAGERALVLDRDERYFEERTERLGTLIALDLTQLAIDTGVEL